MSNIHHILIIDSDPFLRGVYAQTLARSGHRVSIVGTTEDAVHIIRDDTPSLVLYDTSVEKDNGLKFIRALQENNKTNHIKIASLARTWDRDHINRALIAGAETCLVKGHHTSTEIALKVQNMLA